MSDFDFAMVAPSRGAGNRRSSLTPGDTSFASQPANKDPTSTAKAINETSGSARQPAQHQSRRGTVYNASAASDQHGSGRHTLGRSDGNAITAHTSILPTASRLQGKRPLKYGDCICLFDNTETKGFIVHDDARVDEAAPQVQPMRGPSAWTPPNIHALVFQVLPPLKHKASIALAKRLREIALEHNCNPKTFTFSEALRRTDEDADLNRLQKSAAAEKRQNENEILRREGETILYGGLVSLYHPQMRRFVVLCQSRSALLEESNIRVQMRTIPTFSSLFAVRPRFKVVAEGDSVSFNDVVILESAVSPGQFLHTSAKSTTALSGLVERHEVNCGVSPTEYYLWPFREIAQQSQTLVCGGDVVQLFHEEIDAYLTAEGDKISNEPLEDVHLRVLGESDDLNAKIMFQQDASTYFEITHGQRTLDGGPIAWNESVRFLHVPSQSYLCLRERPPSHTSRREGSDSSEGDESDSNDSSDKEPERRRASRRAKQQRMSHRQHNHRSSTAAEKSPRHRSARHHRGSGISTHSDLSSAHGNVFVYGDDVRQSDDDDDDAASASDEDTELDDFFAGEHALGAAHKRSSSSGGSMLFAPPLIKSSLTSNHQSRIEGMRSRFRVALTRDGSDPTTLFSLRSSSSSASEDYVSKQSYAFIQHVASGHWLTAWEGDSHIYKRRGRRGMAPPKSKFEEDIAALEWDDTPLRQIDLSDTSILDDSFRIIAIPRDLTYATNVVQGMVLAIKAAETVCSPGVNLNEKHNLKRLSTARIAMAELAAFLKERGNFVRERQNYFRTIGTSEIVVSLLTNIAALSSTQGSANSNHAPVSRTTAALLKSVTDAAYQLLVCFVSGPYEKNKLHIAFHLTFFQSQLKSAPAAIDFFTAMISDCHPIVRVFSEDAIDGLIRQLRSDRRPEYLTLLGALCECDNAPLAINQEKVCRSLLASKRSPPLVRLVLDDEGVVRIKCFDSKVALSLEDICTYARINSCSFASNPSTRSKHSTKGHSEHGHHSGGPSVLVDDAIRQAFERIRQVLGPQGEICRGMTAESAIIYLEKQIYLFSKLAMDRNEFCINSLCRHGHFSFELYFAIIANESYPATLRAHCISALIPLFVDCSQYSEVLQEIDEIQNLDARVPVKAMRRHQSSGKLLKEAQVNQFVQWIKGVFIKIEVIDPEDSNTTQFLASILHLLYYLVSFGIFLREDFDAILDPVINILSGEFERRTLAQNCGRLDRLFEASATNSIIVVIKSRIISILGLYLNLRTTSALKALLMNFHASCFNDIDKASARSLDGSASAGVVADVIDFIAENLQVEEPLVAQSTTTTTTSNTTSDRSRNSLTHRATAGLRALKRSAKVGVMPEETADSVADAESSFTTPDGSVWVRKQTTAAHQWRCLSEKGLTRCLPKEILPIKQKLEGMNNAHETFQEDLGKYFLHLDEEHGWPSQTRAKIVDALLVIGQYKGYPSLLEAAIALIHRLYSFPSELITSAKRTQIVITQDSRDFEKFLDKNIPELRRICKGCIEDVEMGKYVNILRFLKKKCALNSVYRRITRSTDVAKILLDTIPVESQPGLAVSWALRVLRVLAEDSVEIQNELFERFFAFFDLEPSADGSDPDAQRARNEQGAPIDPDETGNDSSSSSSSITSDRIDVDQFLRRNTLDGDEEDDDDGDRDGGRDEDDGAIQRDFRRKMRFDSTRVDITDDPEDAKYYARVDSDDRWLVDLARCFETTFEHSKRACTALTEQHLRKIFDYFKQGPEVVVHFVRMVEAIMRTGENDFPVRKNQNLIMKLLTENKHFFHDSMQRSHKRALSKKELRREKRSILELHKAYIMLLGTCGKGLNSYVENAFSAILPQDSIYNVLKNQNYSPDLKGPYIYALHANYVDSKKNLYQLRPITPLIVSALKIAGEDLIRAQNDVPDEVVRAYAGTISEMLVAVKRTDSIANNVIESNFDALLDAFLSSFMAKLTQYDLALMGVGAANLRQISSDGQEELPVERRISQGVYLRNDFDLLPRHGTAALFQEEQAKNTKFQEIVFIFELLHQLSEEEPMLSNGNQNPLNSIDEEMLLFLRPSPILSARRSETISTAHRSGADEVHALLTQSRSEEDLVLLERQYLSSAMSLHNHRFNGLTDPLDISLPFSSMLERFSPALTTEDNDDGGGIVIANAQSHASNHSYYSHSYHQQRPQKQVSPSQSRRARPHGELPGVADEDYEVDIALGDMVNRQGNVVTPSDSVEGIDAPSLHRHLTRIASARNSLPSIAEAFKEMQQEQAELAMPAYRGSFKRKAGPMPFALQEGSQSQVEETSAHDGEDPLSVSPPMNGVRRGSQHGNIPATRSSTRVASVQAQDTAASHVSSSPHSPRKKPSDVRHQKAPTAISTADDDWEEEPRGKRGRSLRAFLFGERRDADRHQRARRNPRVPNVFILFRQLASSTSIIESDTDMSTTDISRSQQRQITVRSLKIIHRMLANALAMSSRKLRDEETNIQLLLGIGILDVFSLLRLRDENVVIEAVKCLTLLLNFGYHASQNRISRYLRSKQDSFFFHMVDRHIATAMNEILEFQQLNDLLIKKKRLLELYLDINPSLVQRLRRLPSQTVREEIQHATDSAFENHRLVPVLKLIRNLCEGYNLEFKSYFHYQDFSIKSVNIVAKIMDYFSLATAPFHDANIQIVSQTMETLLELAQGHEPNQQSLFNKHIVDEVNKTMVVSSPLDDESMAARIKGMDEDQREKLEEADAEYQALKVNGALVLLSLLENNDHLTRGLAIEMEKQLDIDAIKAAMEYFYAEKGDKHAGFHFFNVLVRLTDFTGNPHFQRQHEDQALLRVFNKEEAQAEEYYFKRLCSVEILRDGALHKVYFYNKHAGKLNINAKERVIWTVDRKSLADKLRDFLNLAGTLIEDYQYAEWMREKGWIFGKLLNGTEFFWFTLLAVTALMNLAILLNWVAPRQLFSIAPSIRYPWYDTFKIVVGVIHIIVSALTMVSFFLSYPPSIEYSLRDFPLFWVIRRLFKRSPRTATKGSENSLFSFLSLHHIFLPISSILGFIGIGYLYCYPLFHVIVDNDILQRVLLAITKNGKSLLWVAALMSLIIYAYSFVTFAFLRKNMDFYEGYWCDDIFQCFVTTMRFGLMQGGGFGDGLLPETYHWGYQFLRVLFDLSFFIMITIIGLNVVFGIIVDAFAELRDQRFQIEEAMASECFICGRQAQDFDRFGSGFHHHVTHEHSMWAYVYFMLHLKEKEQIHYTSHENFVTTQFAAGDISPFPIAKALCLEGSTGEDDDQLENLSGKMEEVLASLHSLHSELRATTKPNHARNR